MGVSGPNEQLHLVREAAWKARALRAEAERDRYRDALQRVHGECATVPDSENNETVRWVTRTTRVALDGKEK